MIKYMIVHVIPKKLFAINRFLDKNIVYGIQFMNDEKNRLYIRIMYGGEKNGK